MLPLVRSTLVWVLVGRRHSPRGIETFTRRSKMVQIRWWVAKSEVAIAKVAIAKVAIAKVERE